MAGHQRQQIVKESVGRGHRAAPIYGMAMYGYLSHVPCYAYRSKQMGIADARFRPTLIVKESFGALGEEVQTPRRQPLARRRGV